MAGARVDAVARDDTHRFSKRVVPEIRLIAGLGVEGDAHLGARVQHLSRVRADPDQPNLRQVHLIHAELLDEVAAQDFAVAPGDLGENILTRGLDLLGLQRGALLRIGGAVLEVTGLRNPCAQIDAFRPGLLGVVLTRGAQGEVIRKSGIMSVVRAGGFVRAGDAITVDLPAPPLERLQPV